MDVGLVRVLRAAFDSWKSVRRAVRTSTRVFLSSALGAAVQSAPPDVWIENMNSVVVARNTSPLCFAVRGMLMDPDILWGQLAEVTESVGTLAPCTQRMTHTGVSSNDNVWSSRVSTDHFVSRNRSSDLTDEFDARTSRRG